MRRFALLMATFLIVATIPAIALSTVRAQTLPPTKIGLTIFGETINNRQVFSKEQILITEVPTILNITFHNNETTAGMGHSFTINDENGTERIDTGILNPGENTTVEFTVVTMTQIEFKGTTFTPEPSPNGILYFCIPHRGSGVIGQGMVGEIVLAGTLPSGGGEEKGILLRAYWIGIIGIASMLVWIGISYFLIKSSSRHFTDHREHVRRGLP